MIRVVSVNVARAAVCSIGGRQVLTAIGKQPVAGPVAVRAQARVAAWDEPLAPGAMGENLTLHGLLEGDMWIGDYLKLPHCTLAISEPRQPCYKFNHAMGFSHAAKLMLQSGYCGAYLSVIDTGAVEAGDEATLVPGPREVNLRELFQARRERR